MDPRGCYQHYKPLRTKLGRETHLDTCSVARALIGLRLIQRRTALSSGSFGHFRLTLRWLRVLRLLGTDSFASFLRFERRANRRSQHLALERLEILHAFPVHQPGAFG